MSCAVGIAVGPSLAAEVEILVLRIAYRPTTIVGQKRFDSLPHFDGKVRSVAMLPFPLVFDCAHAALYTNCGRRRQAIVAEPGFARLEIIRHGHQRQRFRA